MNGDGEFMTEEEADEDGTTTFPDDPKADPIVGVGGPEGAVKGNVL